MGEPIIKNEDFPILRAKTPGRWELVKEGGRVFFQKGKRTLPFNRRNAQRTYISNRGGRAGGGAVALTSIGRAISNKINPGQSVPLVGFTEGSGLSYDEYQRLKKSLQGMRR